MLAREIDIVVLDDAEIGLANAFYNSIYKTTRDEKKFLWEFRRPPALSGVYVVAKDRSTGKIVGSQGAIPIYLITGSGQTVLTAKSEDTLVHPDFRGLHIFENMYKVLFEECQKRGMATIWGFTYAKKPFTKLGFDTPYIVSQSLMAFDVFVAARYLSKYNRARTTWSKLKMVILSGYSKTVSMFSSGSKLEGITEVVEDRNSMTDNLELAQEVLSTSLENFMIRQDPDYLRWRIADNPYHDKIFQVCFYAESGKVGSILFNHHEAGVWYLTQDLYSSSLTPAQKAAMLKRGVGMLKDSEKGSLNLIRTWDFSHNVVGRNEIGMRRSAGFTQIKHGAVFVWKKLGGELSLDPFNFVLSRIASEGKI